MRDGDIDSVVTIMRAFHAESQFADVTLSEPKLRGFLEMLMKSPKTCAFVYQARDGAIDGLFLGYIGDYFFSTDLAAFDIAFYVRPAKRGSTIAPRLWNAFEAWAREKGARHIRPGISTGIDASKTARFYQRLGMSNVGAVFAKAL